MTEKKLQELLARQVPEAQIGAQIKQVTSPSFRYFLVYDPAPALMKVKCPVWRSMAEKDRKCRRNRTCLRFEKRSKPAAIRISKSRN